MMSRNKATWKIKQQLTKINNKYRVMQLQNYLTQYVYKPLLYSQVSVFKFI